MQAWFCTNPVGVEALQWQEAPTPEPRAGQVRLAVKAASLNFPDLLIVQNKYQFKPPLPFVPGSEFAGVIEAVGEGVTHVKVGDRVAALAGTGGFGSHALVPADKLMPLPDGMPFDHGAAFAFTYGTSQHALLDRGQLKAGETVLVRANCQGCRGQGDCRRIDRREMRAVPPDWRRCHHQLHHRESA
jgi:NADPH2:quinone reductase